MSDKHVTEIEVKTNLSAAEAQIDRLTSKLERASSVAANLGGQNTGARSSSGGGRGHAPGAHTQSAMSGRGSFVSPAQVSAISAGIPPARAVVPVASPSGPGPRTPMSSPSGSRPPRGRGQTGRFLPSGGGGGGGGPVPSPTGHKPLTPAQKREQQNRDKYWANAPGALGMGALNALHTPGAMVYGAGRLVNTVATGVTATSSSRAISSMGRAFGGVVGLAGAAVGAGMGLRVRAMNEYASLEEPLLRGRLAAGLPGVQAKTSTDRQVTEMADRLGLSPQRAAALLEETAIGLGSTGLGNAPRDPLTGKRQGLGTSHQALASQLHRAHLGGASKGPLLARARLYLRGGGALGSSPSAGIGYQMGANSMMGLSGVRADMATSQVNAMVQARANQGLLTDIGGRSGKGVLNFAAGLDANGSHASRGLGAFRATGKVMGQGLGAAQSFGQMFSGMSKAALWGKAFANTSSPMEAMAYMEEMGRNPGAIIDAQKEAWGGDAAYSQLPFMGTRQAADVINYTNKGVGQGGGPGTNTIKAALPVARAKAQADAARTAKVDIGQSMDLIKTLSNVETLLMDLAGPDGVGMKIVDAVNSAVEKAKRWFGP